MLKQQAKEKAEAAAAAGLLPYSDSFNISFRLLQYLVQIPTFVFQMHTLFCSDSYNILVRFIHYFVQIPAIFRSDSYNLLAGINIYASAAERRGNYLQDVEDFDLQAKA